MINQAVIVAAVEHALARKAEKAAEWLQEALSHEGTGLLHIGNVNRSSAQTEYPAEQTGALKASIGAEQVGPLAFAVGSFASLDAEGYLHAEELESTPIGLGGRRFLEQAIHDPELHRVLRETL